MASSPARLMNLIERYSWKIKGILEHGIKYPQEGAICLLLVPAFLTKKETSFWLEETVQERIIFIILYVQAMLVRVGIGVHPRPRNWSPDASRVRDASWAMQKSFSKLGQCNSELFDPSQRLTGLRNSEWEWECPPKCNQPALNGDRM